jgi:Restriction endonuclease
MIENEPGADWRDLQRRVAAILQECGFAAEVGKKLVTARGNVEIDVYATDPTTAPPGNYLCECKRWKNHVPQGEVQTFRTVMGDTGAHFGLFVSAGGFQRGAFDVVEHTNIHLLDWVGFQDLFLQRWCAKYWVPTLRKRGDRLAGYVDPSTGNDAMVREAHGEKIEPAEAVGMFAHDMWGDPFNDFGATIFGRPTPPLAPAIWECRDKYRRYLPEGAVEAKFLRELLDALLDFALSWKPETDR